MVILTFFFEEVPNYSDKVSTPMNEIFYLKLTVGFCVVFFLIITIKFVYQEILNSRLCLNNIKDLP